MVQFWLAIYCLANAEVSLGNLNIPGWVLGLIFVGLSVREIPGCSQGLGILSIE